MLFGNVCDVSAMRGADEWRVRRDQCISKHILDAFRGDITTVLGNFAAWFRP